jgi:hypothetical protein
MTQTAVAANPEAEVFRHQARIVHKVVRLNCDGLSQQDSLVQPEPDGNCLNWVVGHMVNIQDRIIGMLGQPPVMGPALARYDRGSPPLRDGAEALPLDDLLTAWDESAQRFDAGLAGLTPEVLDRHVPNSPSNNPDETVRTMLGTVLFHQGYHAGQTGLLRRIAGKPGAIP